MEWGFYLTQAVVAAVVGFAGGQVALLGDRRRARRRGSGGTHASDVAFRLEHVEGMTWSLVNIGSATASLVRLLPLDDGLEQWPPSPAPGQLATATSELLPTLVPGGSVSVWLSHFEPGQRVIVSWTAENDVGMGPVMLEVPPPTG